MTTASMRACICYFGIFFTSIILATSASAQITNVTGDQAPPIEGAGHDYIHLLSETVNPGNGSISLRINLPVPVSRGFNVPFAIGYDSNASLHYGATGWEDNGGQAWAHTAQGLAQGGWSYVLPYLTVQPNSVSYLFNNSEPFTCGYFTNYLFTDLGGAAHLLPLSSIQSTQNTSCIGYFGPWNPESVLFGSDPMVQAITTNNTLGSSETPPPVTVSDADGTVYYFSAGLSHVIGTVASSWAFLPDWIEDRNGNKAMLTPGSGGTNFTVTDSAGRRAISASGFGTSGNTISTSATTGNYTISWGAGPVSVPNPTATGYDVNPTEVNGQGDGCPGIDILPFTTATRISQITLPNGQSYTFSYKDASSLLTQITYPSGGYVQYTWAQQSAWDWSIFPANKDTARGADCETTDSAYLLQKRLVSFDGKTVSEEQDFTYTPTWITCGTGVGYGCVSGSETQVVWSQRQATVVTKTLQNGSLQTIGTTIYTYSPSVLIPPPNTSINYGGSSASPVETKVVYENASGVVLRTITKQWPFPQWPPTSVTTQLSTGQTSQTTRTFANGTGGQPTDEYEYDYGSPSNPGTPGPLLRHTHIDYASFANTPIFPSAPSILDRPSDVIVCQSATCTTSNEIAETDYLYDGQAVYSVSSATEHDENHYSSSYNVRGNVTTKTVKCLQGCSSPVTTYMYDETGQVLSVKDPCGNGTCSDMAGSNHTTTYSYANSYTVLSGNSNMSYNPSGNTNAYLTQITNSLGQIENFTYDYNSGELTASQDQNDINATRPGATYIYNDPLARPTQVNYPDGGQAELAYSDAAPNPTVTTCQLINGTPGATCSAAPFPAGWKTVISTLDGMGHVVQTELVSDPDAPTFTATTYDGTGKPFQVYNPTRCSPPMANCGTETTWGNTTYTYDALGRTIQVTDADGSVATTSYTGNQMTVTDEAGNQRTTQSDGLGRLNAIWEAPNVSGYNYETQYQYDALNNLICAVQNGTSHTAFTTCAAASATWRPRSFVYDSLSRLTSASNPESGTILYTYDANSNLSTKIAPSPNNYLSSSQTVTTTYSYDALNRITGKSYVDTYNSATPGVTYGYDGVALSCPTQIAISGSSAFNGIGRRTAMCFSSGSKSWQFDPMGRIAGENDRFIGVVPPYSNTVYTNLVVPTISTDTGYRYYMNGDLSELFYPGPNGPPNYEFTLTESGAGRVTAAGDSINHVFSKGTYSPDGQLATAQIGWQDGPPAYNGSIVSNTYNQRMQPVLISVNTAASAQILNLTYNFNAGNGTAGTGTDNGNVIQIANGKSSNRTQNFMYDPLNRIQQAYTSGTNWGETYASVATAAGVVPPLADHGIDLWGNLTNRSGVTGKALLDPLSCGPANTFNQLNTCYGYDFAGNLIQNGSSNYIYDAENRLIATGGFSYIYDGDGQRIEKCTGGTSPGTCATNATGTFYWKLADGSTQAESDLGGNWTAAYGLINGRITDRADIASGSQTDVRYYFQDHLRSTNVVTDCCGNIVNESDYLPYGGQSVITGGDSNHYEFTGKERDSESGLDNFGARYFGSSMGRFMSPDEPFYDGDIHDPQKLNLYSYVRNNPLNSIDPDGHRVEICDTNGQNCTSISNDAYAQAQQQDQYNHAPTLDQLQKTEGESQNITDSSGKVVGTATRINDENAPVEGITPLGERYLAGYAMGAGIGRAFGAAWGAVAGWFGRGAETVGATAGRATFQEVLQGAVEDGSGQPTKSGGFAQATKDFEALEGQSQNLGRVQMKELPDGGKAVLRNFSKDGRPTLEYQPAGGGSKTQWIRYNP